MKTLKTLTIIILVLIAFGLIWARTYSQRPIATTDMIVVTGADGQDYLKKWSDVITFNEGNIDAITSALTLGSDLIVGDSLYVTGKSTFNGQITGDISIEDSVYIGGNLYVAGNSVSADSVYVGGNLNVNGVIYGYDAYGFATITTKGDTMVVDSANVYRTITCPFTNKYGYEFTATDSGIIYTGTSTRIFEITAVINYSTDKNTNEITHAIEINDTLRTGSVSAFKTPTSGYYGHTSILGANEIKTGDRIELVVKSDTANTSIYYYVYNTSIKVIR